jgi:hypothetical protein
MTVHKLDCNVLPWQFPLCFFVLILSNLKLFPTILKIITIKTRILLHTVHPYNIVYHYYLWRVQPSWLIKDLFFRWQGLWWRCIVLKNGTHNHRTSVAGPLRIIYGACHFKMQEHQLKCLKQFIILIAVLENGQRGIYVFFWRDLDSRRCARNIRLSMAMSTIGSSILMSSAALRYLNFNYNWDDNMDGYFTFNIVCTFKISVYQPRLPIIYIPWFCAFLVKYCWGRAFVVDAWQVKSRKRKACASW